MMFETTSGMNSATADVVCLTFRNYLGQENFGLSFFVNKFLI